METPEVTNAPAEYDASKKSIVILGIVLQILGLIAYVFYLLSRRSLAEIITFSPWIFFGLAIAAILVGGLIGEYAKKKKYGSRGLTRFSNIFSWIMIALIVLAIIFVR